MKVMFVLVLVVVLSFFFEGEDDDEDDFPWSFLRLNEPGIILAISGTLVSFGERCATDNGVAFLELVECWAIR